MIEIIFKSTSQLNKIIWSTMNLWHKRNVNSLKKFMVEVSRLLKCPEYPQKGLSRMKRQIFTASTSRKFIWNSLFTSKNVSTRHVPDSICLPPYVKDNVYNAPLVPEIKSEKEIDNMRPACKLAAQILNNVEKSIEIGMMTEDIDALVHKLCIEKGAYPSPLKYKGFPKSVCTSVNHVACHGIPGSLVLKEGDIVNVDITVFYNGYHGDTSRTFILGESDAASTYLVDGARICRDAGIEVCQHGANFSDIGEVIFYCAKEMGFQVIPNFIGHGIGTYFHGPPDIIHVPIEDDKRGQMCAGMIFTVEPIVCDGSPEIKILDDGWTAITTDGCRSAQFEHTILITQDGNEILTQ